MVTSTSTPGSIGMLVTCLTTSEGAWRSIKRLWMRISKRSHVLVPSPEGALRVVILNFLVGIRTGPLTRSFLSREAFFKSAQTFSRLVTLRLVRVMRMRWTTASSGAAPASFLNVDMVICFSKVELASDWGKVRSA
ncbi:unnamed protein product [Pseudo-nitzschia multistriata]|uniref:Uncharacterized protein n=1 Tax=Pseudo-nitzschia multistriata TaxID=183589 RepID=A0A448ZEU4_9STRA|nr:unnamed protein product [Pseudo-nitzschia multistriata]